MGGDDLVDERFHGLPGRGRGGGEDLLAERGPGRRAGCSGSKPVPWNPFHDPLWDAVRQEAGRDPGADLGGEQRAGDREAHGPPIWRKKAMLDVATPSLLNGTAVLDHDREDREVGRSRRPGRTARR